MQQQDPSRAHSLFYRGYAFPTIVADYYAGQATSSQTIARLKQGVSRLNAHGFFTSIHERHLIEKILESNFDSRQQFQTLQPVAKALDYARNLHQHGYRLFLLSNGDSRTFDLLHAKHTSFFDLFEKRIISADIGMIKPYSAIYDYALQTTSINPQQTIFIDDQKENLAIPEKRGITTVLCSDPQQMIHDLQKLLSQS